MEKVKLIFGLLSAKKDLLIRAKQFLAKKYGPIDLESPVIPFDFTTYYDEELGERILRQYISFKKLVKPEYIGRIKRQTIRMERKFMIGNNRKVNIDPGYVSLDKMVLATTKDGTYRIYLGKGIYPHTKIFGVGVYAQSTLYFEKKSFHPWSWTYPDYRIQPAIEFFNNVRAEYKVALKWT